MTFGNVFPVLVHGHILVVTLRLECLSKFCIFSVLGTKSFVYLHHDCKFEYVLHDTLRVLNVKGK